MRFGSSERALFFRAFGELIGSGVSPQQAVEVMARTASGARRALVEGMRRGLAGGGTMGGVFWDARGIVGEMEAGVLRAAERAGRIEGACAVLAEYHEALAAARRAVVRKTAYPIFLLHFGILVLAAPEWVTEGPRAYIEGVVFALAWVYAAGIALFAAGSWSLAMARTSPLAEGLLRAVPLAGGAMRELALGRFAFAYESALEAGVNVPSALDAAGLASGSASLRAGSASMAEAVRRGSDIPAAMRAARGFPQRMVSAIEVGATTGRLDEALRRFREEAFRKGLARIDALSEWLPRLLYLGVVLAMAWRILAVFDTIMGGYRSALGE